MDIGNIQINKNTDGLFHIHVMDKSDRVIRFASLNKLNPGMMMAIAQEIENVVDGTKDSVELKF